MLTSSHTQTLTKYFRQSGRFYYVIIDLQGNFVHVNPLFEQQFNHTVSDLCSKKVTGFFSEADSDKFKQAVQECLQHPAVACQVDLHLPSINDLNQITRWELSALLNEEGVVENIQGIGFRVDELGYMIPSLNHRISEMAERYKAYEQSAEGLWMFESKNPVSVADSPEEIIEYWKKNYFLAECNDNMARMYGFKKAEELIGSTLGQLMDFSDQNRVESLKKFIRNGFQSASVETKEFDRYGNTKYFLNSMTGIVENGKLKRVWGTQQDITDKRKIEKQLEQSELFYRNLSASSLDGLLLTDEKGIITFASPSIMPILGYTSDEVLGKNTFDYAHPEDRKLALSAFIDELNENAKNKFISVRLLKKTGEWMWCFIRGHNLIQNPYVKGMVVYFYDDTMRKEAETALIESEQRFRYQATVLKNVTDIIVTTDLNRSVTSWNKVCEKLTGTSESEAKGKQLRDVLEMNFSPYTYDQISDIIFKEGIWRGEMSFTGRSGEQEYVLFTGSLLHNNEGHHIGLLGVGKDITERKKAEQRLQESEQFYRSMSYHSLDGIVISDINGSITYCSPSVEKISGHEPARLLGHSFFEFVHPDDIPAATDAFIKELNKQSVVNYIYLRLRHATYGWTWCTVRGHNLLNTPGFNALVIYFANDTKRKQAEDKLRKSEENFRNLIFNLKQGVILQDKNRMMTICNQAALDMLGLTEEQLMGKSSFHPSWNVIHEDGRDFPEHTHPVSIVLQTNESVKDVIMGVYRPVTKDRVWLLVNAEPVFAREGEIVNVVCSFTDITEQKRLSRELLEQELEKQKMLTQATIDGQEKERLQIGKELHDNINQHLTTTRLYMEVAKEKATGEVLEMINLSHKTLADIINEIRHLSQSLVPPTLGDIGLIESVHDLCDSLKRAHKFSIDFYSRHFSEDRLPENLKLMLFRIIQEQVNNIVRHAQANSIKIKLQSDAEYILLSISDDGVGFDPFNHKKGLGISNIGNRVGLFKGKVEIEAAPGKGCILSVIIPLDAGSE